jgi:ketosteroid isomerase-like protein
MADLTNYADTVREILARIAENLKRIPKPDVETLLVEDPRLAAFLLRRLGWDAGRRVNNTVIAARIRDGKVWIEEDNTDLSFADELLRRGVPKEDIVLGFQPPQRRHLTEFAVA